MAAVCSSDEALASWLLRPTVVTAQQDPDTISAKQFVVVDDEGNAKAMLTEQRHERGRLHRLAYEALVGRQDEGDDLLETAADGDHQAAVG